MQRTALAWGVLILYVDGGGELFPTLSLAEPYRPSTVLDFFSRASNNSSVHISWNPFPILRWDFSRCPNLSLGSGNKSTGGKRRQVRRSTPTLRSLRRSRKMKKKRGGRSCEMSCAISMPMSPQRNRSVWTNTLYVGEFEISKLHNSNDVCRKTNSRKKRTWSF